MSRCVGSVRLTLTRSTAQTSISRSRLLRRELATEVQFASTSTDLPPPPAPAPLATTPASELKDEPPQSRKLRRRKKYDDNWQRTIETMPFQAYQLALDIIREDRQEKLAMLKKEETKIANLKKFGGLTEGSDRIQGIRKYVEELKVLADINNPRVKYNFDNGITSMDKPIYRYLANKEWRKMRRPVLMQRLETMHVIPDVLPKIDPVVDVQVRFHGKPQEPGVFIDSLTSEAPPTVKIIPFEKGEMLCTIAVVNPDVPNLEKDSYDYRLHWLVSNIKISHMNTQAIGATAKWGAKTLSPYLPPHVQMGAPYHRFALFVFQQSKPIEMEFESESSTSVEAVKGEDGHPVRRKMKEIKRVGFNIRSFQDKFGLTAIGAHMWRGQWDETAKEVMVRNNLPGWDIRYERKAP